MFYESKIFLLPDKTWSTDMLLYSQDHVPSVLLWSKKTDDRKHIVCTCGKTCFLQLSADTVLQLLSKNQASYPASYVPHWQHLWAVRFSTSVLTDAWMKGFQICMIHFTNIGLYVSALFYVNLILLNCFLFSSPCSKVWFQAWFP